MIIINNFSYPIQSVEACVKCFMELAPFPDYITEKGLYTRFAKEAIEGIHILDVKDSKLSDGLNFIGKRVLAFSKVPGFKCDSSPWLPIEESLKMVGK
jgi:hypothetical protein